MDVNDNLYMLEAKEVQYLILTEEERHKVNEGLKRTAEESNKPFVEIETVEDMLKKSYLNENGVGIVPTFGILDRQGHRSNEVQFFADRNPNIMMYQRISDDNSIMEDV